MCNAYNHPGRLICGFGGDQTLGGKHHPEVVGVESANGVATRAPLFPHILAITS
jgi:hypothetical protein